MTVSPWAHIKSIFIQIIEVRIIIGMCYAAKQLKMNTMKAGQFRKDFKKKIRRKGLREKIVPCNFWVHF